MQYGIRLRTSGDDEISYSEFCSLLSGIMPDTPLGRIVSVRAEKDPKVIAKFSKDEKRIRSEWLMRKYNKLKSDPAAYLQYVDDLQNWAKQFAK